MKNLDNIVRIAVPGDGHCAIHTLYLIGYIYVPNFKQNFKQEPKHFILDIREKLYRKLGENYKNVKEWLSVFDMYDLSKENYEITLVDINNPEFSMSKKQTKEKYAYYEFIEFGNNYVKDRQEIEECNHFNLVIPLEEWENLSKTKKNFLKSYKENTKIKISQREFNEIIKNKNLKNNTKNSKPTKKNTKNKKKNKIQIIDLQQQQQQQQKKNQQQQKKQQQNKNKKNKKIQIIDLLD